MNQRNLSHWEKYLAIGLQLSITVILGAAVGFFVDRSRGTTPRWTLWGIVLSLIAAFANFALQVRNIVKEDESDPK